jgi:hypothetical protein
MLQCLIANEATLMLSITSLYTFVHSTLQLVYALIEFAAASLRSAYIHAYLYGATLVRAADWLGHELKDGRSALRQASRSSSKIRGRLYA